MHRACAADSPGLVATVRWNSGLPTELRDASGQTRVPLIGRTKGDGAVRDVADRSRGDSGGGPVPAPRFEHEVLKSHARHR